MGWWVGWGVSCWVVLFGLGLLVKNVQIKSPFCIGSVGRLVEQVVTWIMRCAWLKVLSALSCCKNHCIFTWHTKGHKDWVPGLSCFTSSFLMAHPKWIKHWAKIDQKSIEKCSKNYPKSIFERSRELLGPKTAPRGFLMDAEMQKDGSLGFFRHPCWG